MLKQIEGDLLEITEGMICQQVNCMGKMGAGIAAEMAKKWPQMATDYALKCLNQSPWLLGGSVIVSDINERLRVANLFGQASFGSGCKFTDYDWVDSGFNQIRLMRRKGEKIYVPFWMGCGHAGGRWPIYSAIIETNIPDTVIVKPVNKSKVGSQFS